MPDLKMRYPGTIFVDEDGVTDEDTILEFIEYIAEFVAAYLDCDDYSGAPLELKPEHIDVHLMPYQSEYTRFLGAPILVEITGYDYPERMANINARLGHIRDFMSEAIRGFGDYYREGGSEVAVTFIPIKDGCWA